MLKMSFADLKKRKLKKKIIFSQVIHKKPKKYTELTPGDPIYWYHRCPGQLDALRDFE